MNPFILYLATWLPDKVYALYKWRYGLHPKAEDAEQFLRCYEILYLHGFAKMLFGLGLLVVGGMNTTNDPEGKVMRWVGCAFLFDYAMWALVMGKYEFESARVPDDAGSA